MLEVTRYHVRTRHGGFGVDGSTVYGPNGYDTFSRTFECACGEQLRDGDPVRTDATGALVHANCRP